MLVALTPEQRDAILTVLENVTRLILGECRGVLIWDAMSVAKRRRSSSRLSGWLFGSPKPMLARHRVEG